MLEIEVRAVLEPYWKF